MSETDFRVEVWNIYSTHNLVVEPQLLGASHQWREDDYEITIKIPSQLPPRDKFPSDLSRLFCFVYSSDGNEWVPQAIQVRDVDVSIQIPQDVNLPEEILNYRTNNYPGLSDAQQILLKSLTSQCNFIVERAFDKWLKTLRWKCQDAFIGRTEIHAFKTNSPTLMKEVSSKKTIWISPVEMIINMEEAKTVTVEQWDNVQAALNQAVKSPIYYDVMFDGEDHLRNGDLKRAVTDFAVATEACLRQLTLNSLPEGLRPSILKFIDEANIRQVINHFIKDILNDDQLNELKSFNSNLQQLFNDRNTILHSGTLENLSQEKCQKYLEATRFVISLAE